MKAIDYIGIYPPKGGYALRYKYLSSVALSTSGTTTDLELQIPVGAGLDSFEIQVTSDIAGLSLTGVTIAADWSGGLNGLTGVNLVTSGNGNLSAGTYRSRVYGRNLTTSNIVGATPANLQIAISGGADNTPSAGAVRVAAYYWSLSGSLS